MDEDGLVAKNLDAKILLSFKTSLIKTLETSKRTLESRIFNQMTISCQFMFTVKLLTGRHIKDTFNINVKSYLQKHLFDYNALNPQCNP